MTAKSPKFLVDEMLGKLAKRLRILGFDTKYLKDISDEKFFRTAKKEGRTLLTRDTMLSRRKGIKSLLIRSTDIKKQIEQALKDLKLKINGKKIFSRCSECNSPVKSIKKEDAKKRVPEAVYLYFTKFRKCPKCKRIYWKGSHYDKLVKAVKIPG